MICLPLYTMFNQILDITTNLKQNVCQFLFLTETYTVRLNSFKFESEIEV